jgi:hypothetical protein
MRSTVQQAKKMQETPYGWPPLQRLCLQTTTTSTIFFFFFLSNYVDYLSPQDTGKKRIRSSQMKDSELLFVFCCLMISDDF